MWEGDDYFQLNFSIAFHKISYRPCQLKEVTTLEWKPILDWLRDINDGSDIFNDGIFYKDIPPEKLHELYETGTELIGDLDEFKIALYEQKPLKSFQ